MEASASSFWWQNKNVTKMIAKMIKTMPQMMFQLLLSKANNLIGWTKSTIPAAKIEIVQKANTQKVINFGTITKIIR